MRKFKSIGSLVLTLALIISGCEPKDNSDYSLGAKPTAADLDFTATPQSTVNIIDFQNTSPMAGVATWDFGNGSKSKGEAVSAQYPIHGDYTVVMTLYTEGGSTSISKVVTISEDDMSLLNTPWFNALTGGASDADGKTWVYDQYHAGHFGVGPFDAASPSWWAAAPEDKTQSSMYTQEFTFTQVGLKLDWVNNGSVYTNEPGRAAMASLGFTTSVAPPAGDFDVVYPLAPGYTFSLNEADGTLTLSDGAFLGHYTGSSTYQILKLTESQLIADNPTLNRRALSQAVCQSWGWRQPNGVLKDAICRSLMLQLHRAGHIELPPPLARHTNRGSRRWHIAPVSIDCRPLRAALRDLPPLSFRQVRRTPQEPLFNALLHQHHELGYRQPVGEHLKYLVYAGQWLVAALAWSSAAHGLTCRDQFIGWSREARRRNRHLLAYNTRFLVPPWVQVPHLASHVLGRMARRLPADWQQVYGHPVYFLETFVDPARHRGTCYRAANWIVLGQTFGRGHRCPTSRPNRPPKLVLGYPLVKRFRELLAEEGLESMEVRQHEG